MRIHIWFLAMLAVAFLVFKGIPIDQSQAAATGKMTATETIKDWKAKPKELAQKLIKQYGQPAEVTSDRLIWHDNSPWKLTELVNEEIPHAFPKPHNDMLRQVIDYQVSPDKFDELAQYDGSVTVERTKGEIAARCDSEMANFLALNLANDIVTETKSVSEARQFYADTMINKKNPEYTKGFQFDVPKGGTADPDRKSTMAALQ